MNQKEHCSSVVDDQIIVVEVKEKETESPEK